MATLLWRVLTLAFLFVSLGNCITNTETLEINFTELKVYFKDVYAYRYTLTTTVMGLAYMLLPAFFTLYDIATGNGNGNPLVEFYGDKVISYALATGRCRVWSYKRFEVCIFRIC